MPPIPPVTRPEVKGQPVVRPDPKGYPAAPGVWESSPLRRLAWATAQLHRRLNEDPKHTPSVRQGQVHLHEALADPVRDFQWDHWLRRLLKPYVPSVGGAPVEPAVKSWIQKDALTSGGDLAGSGGLLGPSQGLRDGHLGLPSSRDRKRRFLRVPLLKAETGFFVGLWLDEPSAEALAMPRQEPPDKLHVTVLYSTADLDERQAELAQGVVSKWAREVSVAAIPLGKYGIFRAADQPPADTSGEDVLYAEVPSEAIHNARQRLIEALSAAGVPLTFTHDEYKPHVTLAYLPPSDQMPEGGPKVREVRLDEIVMSVGDRTWSMPLGNVQKVLREENDGWHVYAESGRHMGGPYESRKDALVRLGQIEHFKKFDPLAKHGDHDQKTHGNRDLAIGRHLERLGYQSVPARDVPLMSERGSPSAYTHNARGGRGFTIAPDGRIFDIGHEIHTDVDDKVGVSDHSLLRVLAINDEVNIEIADNSTERQVRTALEIARSAEAEGKEVIFDVWRYGNSPVSGRGLSAMRAALASHVSKHAQHDQSDHGNWSDEQASASAPSTRKWSADGALKALARRYDRFEDFSRDYSAKNYHGVYWHLTTDPDFKIDPKRSPSDLSSMSDGSAAVPGLMVTTDIENWAATFTPPDKDGFTDESKPSLRTHVALIDLSGLEPNKEYREVSRGYGHEMFVFAPEKARVVRVLPLADAIKEQERIYRELPSSEAALKRLWVNARAVEKHASHDQDDHGNWAEGLTYKPIGAKAKRINEKIKSKVGRTALPEELKYPTLGTGWLLPDGTFKNIGTSNIHRDVLENAGIKIDDLYDFIEATGLVRVRRDGQSQIAAHFMRPMTEAQKRFLMEVEEFANQRVHWEFGEPSRGNDRRGYDAREIPVAKAEWVEKADPGDDLPPDVLREIDIVADQLAERSRNKTEREVLALRQQALSNLAGSVRLPFPQEAMDAAVRGNFDLVRGISATTRSMLRDLLIQTFREARAYVPRQGMPSGTQFDFARKIRQSWEGLSRDRAELIAVTEYNHAASAATLNQYRSTGVTHKRWFTVDDDAVCPICERNAAIGEVPIDSPFPSGHDDPPGHPRCRCNVSAALGPEVAKSKDLARATVAKHGDHDQKTHGRRDGVSDRAALSRVSAPHTPSEFLEAAGPGTWSQAVGIMAQDGSIYVGSEHAFMLADAGIISQEEVSDTIGTKAWAIMAKRGMVRLINTDKDSSARYLALDVPTNVTADQERAVRELVSRAHRDGKKIYWQIVGKTTATRYNVTDTGGTRLEYDATVGEHGEGRDSLLAYLDGRIEKHGQHNQKDHGNRDARAIEPPAKGPFFHGTTADLKPGDIVRAPGSNDERDAPYYDPAKVYLTTGEHLAERYAVGRAGRKGGQPRIYEVEPIGDVERDPEYVETGLGEDQHMAGAARVVREIALPGQTRWNPEGFLERVKKHGNHDQKEHGDWADGTHTWNRRDVLRGLIGMPVSIGDLGARLDTGGDVTPTADGTEEGESLIARQNRMREKMYEIGYDTSVRGGPKRPEYTTYSPSNELVRAALSGLPPRFTDHFADRHVSRPGTFPTEIGPGVGGLYVPQDVPGSGYSAGDLAVGRGTETNTDRFGNRYDPVDVMRHELLHAYSFESPDYAPDAKAGFANLHAAANKDYGAIAAQRDGVMRNVWAFANKGEWGHAWTELADLYLKGAPLPPNVKAYFEPLTKPYHRPRGDRWMRKADSSARFAWEPDDVLIDVEKHATHDQQEHGNWADDLASSEKRGEFMRSALAEQRKSMSRWETETLAGYTDAAYTLVNPSLRGQMKADTVTLEMADALDSVIARTKTDRPLTVYRGVRVSQKRPERVADENALLDALATPGATFTDKAFVSTSLSNTDAVQFAHWSGVDAKHALVRMRLPAGTNVAYGSYAEREIILPRNSRFLVGETKDGVTDVTLLPPVEKHAEHDQEDHGDWADGVVPKHEWRGPGKTAAEISGVTPSAPLRHYTAYHVTRRENAESILRNGFDLQRVKPRWQNDLAVSLSRGLRPAVDYFTPRRAGATFDTEKYAVLEFKFRGRLADPKNYGAAGDSARDFRRRLIADGYDGQDVGGTIFVHNTDAILSIREIDPLKKHADHDQEDHGNWADGIGEKPERRDGESYEDYSKREAEYRAKVVEAVVLGHIEPRDARERAWLDGHPDEWKPLPKTMYHVTTAADAVQRDGLKTRAALGGTEGGLGGGPDDLVSFTTDPKIADGILDGIREMRRVATGEMTVADVLAEADKWGIGEHVRNMYSGDSRNKALESLLRGMKRSPDRPLDGAAPKEPGDWRPAPDSYHWTGGDGKERYAEWERPMTREEIISETGNVWKYMAGMRESRGGPFDPLFWGDSWKRLANIDLDQIKVLEYEPASEGVRGQQVGGMAEVRTLPKAVRLKRVVKTAGATS